MTAVTPFKPGAHTGAVITNVSGGAAKITASATGADFYIKIFRGVFSFNPVGFTDVTGDGDSGPVYDHGGMLGGTFRLTGLVPAVDSGASAATIGIDDLKNSSKNPLGTTNRMKVFLASAKTLDMNIIIRRMDIQYDRKAAFIGVALSGEMSDSAGQVVEGVA